MHSEKTVRAILHGSGLYVKNSWLSLGNDPFIRAKKGDRVYETSGGIFVVPEEDILVCSTEEIRDWVERGLAHMTPPAEPEKHVDTEGRAKSSFSRAIDCEKGGDKPGHGYPHR
jgi:hypothetical protein